METITKVQFDNLISSPASEILRLPEHIQQSITSLRECTKSGKAYLLLTQPKGQDHCFLEYVEVDMLCPREMYETRLHAQINRGVVIAV